MTRRHHSVKRLAGELSVAEEFIIALGRERLWRGFKKCERMNISSCCRGGGGGGGGSLREQLRYNSRRPSATGQYIAALVRYKNVGIRFLIRGWRFNGE